MTFKIFQVDAFTDEVFKGNPAAVMKLDEFLPDRVMQNIAMENNLAETAFVVETQTGFDLRWFTPLLEAGFCGHATVATAHILRTEYGHSGPFQFNTLAGRLTVDYSGDYYALDAPITPARPVAITQAMKALCPYPITHAFWGADNLYLVLESAEHVKAFIPDFAAIKSISDDGVALTAKGEGDYDCVSRYFAPLAGIPEDPVTGSAHAAIGPYWADQLDIRRLTAYQASARGGILHINIGDDRLTLSGKAVTYLRGEILID